MPDLVRSLTVAGFLSALVPFLGCGKSAEPSAPETPIRQIDRSSLPALGEYMPPLDGGRIEIAGPADWELLPRKDDYVVLFRASPNDDYPMILVKATDSSEPLTRENVAAFASAMGGSAEPAAVGERVGVLRARRGKEPGSIDGILEQLIFTTVIGARTYALELRTRRGRVGEYQDMLFAVVAGMRPSGNESTDAPAGATPSKKEREKAKPDDADKELDEIFQ